MKISDSTISFLANHYIEQKKASVNSQAYRSRINTRLQEQAGQEGLSDQLEDRVSISKTRSDVVLSNYSSVSAGRTIVKTSESEKLSEKTWQASVEKMVGGMINKKVVLQNFTQNAAGTDLNPTDEQALKSMQGAGNGNQTREMILKKTDLLFEEEQVVFASTGEVATEDGRVIEFSFDMKIGRTYFSEKEEQTLIRSWQERAPLHDPLVISLDRNAPQLTDTAFEFDLFNDGFNRYISFVAPGSGFLAFDKNNDQIINDGSELFGPVTGNGFSELAVHDSDNNNWIDENDAVFDQLSVWTRDEYGNDRLISLKEAGIGAIYLDHETTHFQMNSDQNELKGRLSSTGMVLHEAGNAGTIHQVDLAFRSAPDRIRSSVPPRSHLQAVDPSKIKPDNILTNNMTIQHQGGLSGRENKPV